jgi:gas vesicle protein
MKYERKLKSILRGGPDNTALVGFALVSGLAIGAALAVLLAPKSGRNLRKGVSDFTGQLTDDISDLFVTLKSRFASEEPEAQDQNEDHTPAYVSPAVHKKPKSDIREIIHEAHEAASNLS